jgi:hypothetical protein
MKSYKQALTSFPESAEIHFTISEKELHTKKALHGTILYAPQICDISYRQ